MKLLRDRLDGLCTWSCVLVVLKLTTTVESSPRDYFDGFTIPNDEYCLGIMHMADIHGAYIGALPNNSAKFDEPSFGGAFSPAFPTISRLPKYHPISLFSGDFFYGSFVDVMGGLELAINVSKHMQFDILTVGDSDFNYGINFLVSFMKGVSDNSDKNKFVCTNMDFTMLNETLRTEIQNLCPRHRILHWNDKYIGFLGYVTPSTQATSKTGKIRFRDEIVALTDEVKVLRKKGIKIIIALGHSGFERDVHIAKSVPSLDVVVSSHSHTWAWYSPYADNFGGFPYMYESEVWPSHVFQPYPAVVVQRSGRRVLVLTAGKFAMALGYIYIRFNDDDEVHTWFDDMKLYRYESQTLFLQRRYSQEQPTKGELVRDLNPLAKKVGTFMQKVVGSTFVQLASQDKLCQRSECNLGNIIADAYVWNIRTKTNDFSDHLPTVAFVDAGSIGESVPIGNITATQIQSMVIDVAFIHAVKLTGLTVMQALEHSVTDGFTTRFLQVSGAIIVYNMSRPAGERVTHVELLCNDCMVPQYDRIEPETVYTIAMPQAMAEGSHGYRMIPKERLALLEYGIMNAQAVYEYIKQRKKVQPKIEGRITVVGKPSEPLASTAEHGKPASTSRAACGQPTNAATLLVVVLWTFLMICAKTF